MCVLWVGILVLVVVRRSALGSRNLLITDQVEDFILSQTLRSIPSNNVRSYKLIFQPFTPFIQTKKNMLQMEDFILSQTLSSLLSQSYHSRKFLPPTLDLHF